MFVQLQFDVTEQKAFEVCSDESTELVRGLAAATAARGETLAALTGSFLFYSSSSQLLATHPC